MESPVGHTIVSIINRILKRGWHTFNVNGDASDRMCQRWRGTWRTDAKLSSKSMNIPLKTNPIAQIILFWQVPHMLFVDNFTFIKTVTKCATTEISEQRLFWYFRTANMVWVAFELIHFRGLRQVFLPLLYTATEIFCCAFEVQHLVEFTDIPLTSGGSPLT